MTWSARTGVNLQREARYVAHNYNPLPVVLVRGDGSWVTDVEGRKYLDCLAGYSSLNFGHSDPRIIAAARGQLESLTMTARAFHNDRLPAFAEALCNLVDEEMMLPLNTGVEAVEAAIKTARAWGYRLKGVPKNQAEIIVMSGNFHGRTTTVVSFSDDPVSHGPFGPWTPGFKIAQYGSVESVESLITPNTVAILSEPIQGESGVIIPPADFFPRLRALCDEHNILLVADEVQSGLGRTGTTLAMEQTGVRADITTLGKALGGGVVPVSAIVGRREVIGCLRSGEHGSTFGGNPLAAAVGLEVVQILSEGTFQAAAAERGKSLGAIIEPHVGNGVLSLRRVGLWAGIDIDPQLGTGRKVCETLAKHGVLSKDTHGSTIRISPPLCVAQEELDFFEEAFNATMEELSGV